MLSMVSREVIQTADPLLQCLAVLGGSFWPPRQTSACQYRADLVQTQVKLAIERDLLQSERRGVVIIPIAVFAIDDAAAVLFRRSNAAFAASRRPGQPVVSRCNPSVPH